MAVATCLPPRGETELCTREPGPARPRRSCARLGRPSAGEELDVARERRSDGCLVELHLDRPDDQGEMVPVHGQCVLPRADHPAAGDEHGSDGAVRPRADGCHEPRRGGDDVRRAFPHPRAPSARARAEARPTSGSRRARPVRARAGSGRGSPRANRPAPWHPRPTRPPRRRTARGSVHPRAERRGRARRAAGGTVRREGGSRACRSRRCRRPSAPCRARGG